MHIRLHMMAFFVCCYCYTWLHLVQTIACCLGRTLCCWLTRQDVVSTLSEHWATATVMQ